MFKIKQHSDNCVKILNFREDISFFEIAFKLS